MLRFGVPGGRASRYQLRITENSPHNTGKLAAKPPSKHGGQCKLNSDLAANSCGGSLSAVPFVAASRFGRCSNGFGPLGRAQLGGSRLHWLGLLHTGNC